MADEVEVTEDATTEVEVTEDATDDKEPEGKEPEGKEATPGGKPKLFTQEEVNKIAADARAKARAEATSKTKKTYTEETTALLEKLATVEAERDELVSRVTTLERSTQVASLASKYDVDADLLEASALEGEALEKYAGTLSERFKGRAGGTFRRLLEENGKPRQLTPAEESARRLDEKFGLKGKKA